MNNQFIEDLEKAKAAAISDFLEVEMSCFDQDRYKNIIQEDKTAVLFFIDFRQSKFLFLSSNTPEVEGYTKEEIIAMGPFKFYDLIHPADNIIMNSNTFVSINKYFINLDKDDISDYKIGYNYRLKQKDGTYVWLDNEFIFLMAGDNYEPLIIVGTAQKKEQLASTKLYARIFKLNEDDNYDMVFENIIED